jgi:hypothetical protein
MQAAIPTKAASSAAGQGCRRNPDSYPQRLLITLWTIASSSARQGRQLIENPKNDPKTGKIILYESVTCKFPPGRRSPGNFLSFGKKIVHKWVFRLVK